MQTGEKVEIEQILTSHPQGAHEATVYRDLEGGIGIPSVHWCGIDGEHYVVVHDELGPSLADFLWFCNGKFSLKTVAMLAWQLITRLETIHERGIVYGNMALDNIYMGIGKRSLQVHIVNFNHARRYRYLSYSHLPLVVEKSAREDIESLSELLFALLSDDEIPLEFTLYFQYSNSLHINQKPDYNYLRRLFRDLLSGKAIQFDFCFDWMIPSQELPQFNGE
jgi:serine/threonine protein kinase